MYIFGFGWPPTSPCRFVELPRCIYPGQTRGKATHPSGSPSAVKCALQAAGTLDWNNSDDGDSTKERLRNVATF